MSGSVYRGELRSPSIWELRRPETRQRLARALAAWSCSSEEVVDRTIHEIFYGHEGRLVDYRGQPIDKESLELVELFGEDAGRSIRALCECAGKLPRKRLQHRLVDRMMYIAFAVEIERRRSAQA